MAAEAFRYEGSQCNDLALDMSEHLLTGIFDHAHGSPTTWAQADASFDARKPNPLFADVDLRFRAIR
jgi:hypothetical protein